MEYKDLEKVNAEIKTVDIKGKSYAEVPQRVKAFRTLFPEGTIETELISCKNGVCVFKATARAGETILATGHAYEKEGSNFINSTSYIENCETSAVGRCLGFMGIGIDTSIASYEEVQNARANQNKPASKSTGKGDMVNEINHLAAMKGVAIADLCNQAGVMSVADMPAGQMRECINFLKGLE